MWQPPTIDAGHGGRVWPAVRAVLAVVATTTVLLLLLLPLLTEAP